ncbi:hypothetical protein RIF29_26691 [Crotalaria pallida]|uniref:Uncharacterized protein n=1 Tax=Crotalaria pallida TaxID=3830 RepID=A0AAN9EMZ7_CROPI
MENEKNGGLSSFILTLLAIRWRDVNTSQTKKNRFCSSTSFELAVVCYTVLLPRGRLVSEDVNEGQQNIRSGFVKW